MDAARICDPPLLVCNLRLVEDCAGVCRGAECHPTCGVGRNGNMDFCPVVPESTALQCGRFMRLPSPVVQRFSQMVGGCDVPASHRHVHCHNDQCVLWIKAGVRGATYETRD